MLRLLLQPFLLFTAVATIPQCRNQNGEAVDWWLILKEANGKRYVYYDSSMAQANALQRPTFQPMSSSRLLDDPLTSPILHTIYAGVDAEPVAQGADRSDLVFVAVNDQTVKVKNTMLDAYGAAISENSGHVKFMTAAQVVYGARPRRDESTVYSYLIQHSLPRFPNVPKTDQATHGSIFANKLPVTRKEAFADNLSKKGQHFMCMSFEDKQMLDPQPEVATGVYKHQLRYRRAEMAQYLVDGQHHFASILHYLKVVHAAVVATSYDPFREGMGVFHQYLNSYNSWSPAETMEQRTEKNLNMARTSVNVGYDSPHLCPLWPLKRRVKVEAGGLIKKLYTYTRDIYSMRSSRDANVGICLSHQLNNKLCLASTHMTSTNHQYSITSTLLMKGRAVGLGLFDDLIAPMAVFPGDRVAPGEGRAMSMRLIVQSWIDNATLPSNNKQPAPGITLTLENITTLSLPTEAGTRSVVNSLGQDHSKWALLLPDASVGSLPSLFCVADLNRTHRQEHRGGGASCFSDPLFTELMLGLSPKVAPGFLDKAIPYDSLQHLYAGVEVKEMSAIAYDFNGQKCKAFFLGSRRGDSVFLISKHVSPVESGSQEVLMPELPERIVPSGDILIADEGLPRVINGLLHLVI